MIERRDEFDDVDVVFPWRIPYFVTRNEHTYTRPFYARVGEEEIRVTLKKINYHPRS